jgi:hypothetical protein
MKKKFLLIALLLLLTVGLTGCRFRIRLPFLHGGTGTQEGPIEDPTPTEEQGTIFTRYTLYDGGIPTFLTVLPSEWKANITSNWNVVNSSIPGVATVTISSPDGLAKITILSRHSFVENAKFNEGINKDYYTTYLHKMNASQYISYVMKNNYTGYQLLKAENVPEDTVSMLNSYNTLRAELAKKDAELLQTGQYGVTISVRNDGITAAKEIYQNGNKYAEISTGVCNISTILKNNLSSLLDSTATTWEMPYLIIYEAASEEAYDEYYDTYNFIIANSSFTTRFYGKVEYVSSVIVNYYTSIYAERSKAALQATNDYINMKYSSTSSQSTNDKVMEMWDDVINEVDKYKLEDGSYLKTSIYNETVAQNGNEIYVGSKAGIPIGFTEVAKTYD